MSRGHAFGTLLRRNREAFRANDFDVGDPEETEHVAQVGLLEIAAALLVEASARRWRRSIFLPPARPSTPLAVYWKVFPATASRSIQAFRVDGMPKLYIGAPITTTSASRNSCNTRPASAVSVGIRARQRSTADMRQRRGVQVAIGDLQPAHGVHPARGDRRAEFAAGRLLSEDAGIDVEEFHRVSPDATEGRDRSILRRCTAGIKVVKCHLRSKNGTTAPRRAMQDLNDLYYFAMVVDHGGFAAAERALGIPKSRLSRRITQLEADLGVRLLQRSTRRFAVTEVGNSVLSPCAVDARRGPGGARSGGPLSAEPRGVIRVSVPVGLAQQQMPQLLPEFLARYPQVRLQLHVSNRRST